MERPSADTIAYYEVAVPADRRVRKGQMFGHPCAFVNGNMFFGTFHQTVVVRVGEKRATDLAKGKMRIFEPMPGRLWKQYVQVDAGALSTPKIRGLAEEALEWTDKLPVKKGKGGGAGRVPKPPVRRAAPAVTASAKAKPKTKPKVKTLAKARAARA